MMKRFRLTLTVIAVVAVAMLVFRPLALQTLGVPYGSHNSPAMEIVKVKGSPHCELLSDCESISFATIGIDVAQGALVVLITGLVMSIAAVRVRRPYSWPVLVPNPPPLALLG